MIEQSDCYKESLFFNIAWFLKTMKLGFRLSRTAVIVQNLINLKPRFPTEKVNMSEIDVFVSKLY